MFFKQTSINIWTFKTLFYQKPYSPALIQKELDTNILILTLVLVFRCFFQVCNLCQ